LTVRELGNKNAYDAAAASRLAVTRDRIEERVDSIASERREVSFELPGMKIPVARRFAPMLWMTIVIALLLYLVSARSRILNLCGKGLRIYRDLGASDADVTDLLCHMPVWLAPLPRRDGRASCSSLRGALGWQRSYSGVLVLVGVCVAVILALALRVMQTGRAAAVWFPFEQRLFVQTLVVTTVGLLALAMWGWFRPVALPDHFPAEPNPNMWRRREFVTATAAVGVLALLEPLRSVVGTAAASTPAGKRPRFRRRALNRFAAGVPSGFYRNDVGPVIHRVDGSGTIRGVVCVNPAHLKPSGGDELAVTFGTRESPRVHLATAACALEQEAIKHIKAGRLANAIKLLEAAVQHDFILKRPRSRVVKHRLSTRAYDLLAALSVRFEPDRGALGRLITNLRPVSAEPEIQTRLAKWTNPASTWHKRWSDRSKPVRFAGLPM
jgi:hypothetical protein